MTTGIDDILEDLPRYREAAEGLKDTLLSNLVMIGEIPAPTFHEERRLEFLSNRFIECELQSVSTDEKGNVLGIVPGETDENILVVAHGDTIFEEKVDHTITVQPDGVSGAGVGDNSLGLATLMTLPPLLEALELKLRCNLVLMGSARSLGRGNLEGLGFFLDNKKMSVDGGLCVEGVQLGRLSYSAIGMVRGEITVTVPEEYDWTRLGAVGAIHTLNDVINRINAIPLPRDPRTSIVLGSIEGGKTFNTLCTHAVLRFEVRSESEEMVTALREKIEEISAEVSARTDAIVKLEILARRKPGGIEFAHPLVHCARAVLKHFEIEPRFSPSLSELAAFIARDIPAVTVGITQGEHLAEKNETLRITPMFTGLAQVVALLVALDRELCRES